MNVLPGEVTHELFPNLFSNLLEVDGNKISYKVRAGHYLVIRKKTL